MKKNENKNEKEPGIGPYFKKIFQFVLNGFPWSDILFHTRVLFKEWMTPIKITFRVFLALKPVNSSLVVNIDQV